MKRDVLFLLVTCSFLFFSNFFVYPNTVERVAGNTISNPPDTLSFSKHIWPIIENNCSNAECHGGGQYPTLVEYKKIRKYAQMIKFRIQFKKRPMPPLDSKDTLSQQEVEKIVTWIDKGAKNN